MVNDSLDQLNWFDVTNQIEPVHFISQPYDSLEKIPTNTLTLAPEGTMTDPLELGSLLSEKHTTYFLDFFSENEVIGVHMIQDLEDIIQGRMPSIGRDRPNLIVYDYSQATPPQIFTCQLDDVQIDRGRISNERWKYSWFACSFVVIDTYGTEDY